MAIMLEVIHPIVRHMHSKIKRLKLDSNTLSLRQFQIVVDKNNSVPNAQ